MIGFTVAQFTEILAGIGWPFIRILSFIATEPVLGNRSVPLRAKILLALFLAGLIAPTLPAVPRVELMSAAGILVLGQQLLIGVSMGFMARIAVAAAEMAGQLAGLQVGLGFAVFFDPAGSGQTPVVAQFYGLIAILTLLATNGHHLLLTALSESFRTLPIAAEPLASAGFRSVVFWGGEIFRIGLMMALPVVGALLVANVAIGILTRAAPQLNLFAVGFPITLSLGFLMLYLSLPTFVPMIERLEVESVAAMMHVLEQWRSAR
ncbi:MAG: flagellar biosynthetic protein FliR [Burkholderiales bacterium]